MEYYEGHKTLSYNKEFNFVVGNRSAGKSFFWKEFCIKRFLNHGEKFVYMRRYDNELESISRFFEDVAFKFPDVEFSARGRKFYINGEIAGYAISLNTAYKMKSNTYVDVTTIFYDEFLPENGRYLKNEFDLAKSFYQTVARGGGKMVRAGVRFVFVANHVTLYNPYFSGLGVRVRPGDKYVRGPGYVIEIFNNETVNEELAKLEGVNAILNSGTYGEYANNGKFLLDNDAFIEPMKEDNSRYVLTIRYDGKDYGVYKYADHFHISMKVKKDYPFRYTFSNDDHEIDYLYVAQWGQNMLLIDLKRHYEAGKLFFTNQEAKNMFLEVVNYTN